MPTEDELRQWLRETPAVGVPESGDGIDTDALTRRVLRSAGRRRRAKQFGAGATVALASVSLAVFAIPQLSFLTAGPEAFSTSGGQQLDSPMMENDDSGTHETRDSQYTLQKSAVMADVHCGAVLPPSAESGANPGTGLRVELAFPPSASRAVELIHGTVTITNTGGSVVDVELVSPAAVALVHESRVLWYSAQADGSVVAATLAPGASLDIDASFVPQRCTSDELLRSGAPLPPVDPGEYLLYAGLDVQLPDQSLEAIWSPAASIRID